MEGIGPAFGNKPTQRHVGIAAAGPQSQPVGHAANVRIHWKFLPAEGEKKDHIRRLLPHPGKGKKIFLRLLIGKPGQKIQGKISRVSPDPPEDLLDPSGPFPVNPGRPNGPGHLGQGGAEDLFPGGKTPTQLSISSIAITIGGVLGKDGLNEGL